MIRKIQEETSTEINVEDDGTVEIAAVSGENARKAIDWINSLTREVEWARSTWARSPGSWASAPSSRSCPARRAWSIGELADYHVPTVEDVVSVGDEIMVVVLEVDRQGRINLSRKAAMQRHLAKETVQSGAPAAATSRRVEPAARSFLRRAEPLRARYVFIVGASGSVARPGFVMGGSLRPVRARTVCIGVASGSWTASARQLERARDVRTAGNEHGASIP